MGNSLISWWSKSFQYHPCFFWDVLCLSFLGFSSQLWVHPTLWLWSPPGRVAEVKCDPWKLVSFCGSCPEQWCPVVGDTARVPEVAFAYGSSYKISKQANSSPGSQCCIQGHGLYLDCVPLAALCGGWFEVGRLWERMCQRESWGEGMWASDRILQPYHMHDFQLSPPICGLSFQSHDSVLWCIKIFHFDEVQSSTFFFCCLVFGVISRNSLPSPRLRFSYILFLGVLSFEFIIHYESNFWLLCVEIPFSSTVCCRDGPALVRLTEMTAIS